MGIIDRYILKEFLTVLCLCLFTSISLFLVVETFDKMRVFVAEGASFYQVVSYLLFKTPLVVQLMIPVSVLVATLISLGRLSQLSEVTAMRACGLSVLYLARPLIGMAVIISVLMFVGGETIVPWAHKRVEEIYNIDIKQKHLKGNFNKEHFWYRDKEQFYSIGFYDSRNATLRSVSLFVLDDEFRLRRRLDAYEAVWGGTPLIGWVMKDVVETRWEEGGKFEIEKFSQLPLLIDEEPSDFFNFQIKPESLSYFGLKSYIEKLSSEGVPATAYLVDLA